jgi:uncharacterized membrane protein YbaN (DUF454 family)
MRFQRKIVLIFGCIALLWMCIGLAFAFYVVKHPGLVPRSISVSLLALFVLTIVGGGIVVSRVVRKQVSVETVEEGRIRRARAMKGMKLGLVLWGLIFLNGIRLVAQREVPLSYAVPGLAIDVFLIVAFWTSLRRLKRFEATASDSRQQHTQQ